MITVLLFGASGMAGGSVLDGCLASEFVSAMRIVTRRPVLVNSSKLNVVLHQDYLDFAAIPEAFQEVDLCLFCLGISVTQTSGEAEYRKITQNIALAAASALKQHSPNAVFHYISGQGTSATSRMMWARVKAETEQKLIALNGAVCFRPAAIGGKASARTPAFIKLLIQFLGVLSPFRSLYVKGEDLGRAMLQAYRETLKGQIIEAAGIRNLADRALQRGSS